VPRRIELAKALGGAFVFSCLFVGMVSIAAAQNAVALKGNHPAQAASLVGAAHADSAMQLNLTIMLGLRNVAALDQLVADQQNPASARYHKWLTPAQFTRRFGPTHAQLHSVEKWLTSEGFHVTSSDQATRTIHCSASVAQVEHTFSTSIVQRGTSFANTADPVIPAKFAQLIVNIDGLDNIHASMPAGLKREGLPTGAAFDLSSTLIQ